MADASDPFENTAEKEMAHQLFASVKELEDDVQAVIHLHYFQGLSLKETGEVLNIATSTVKYRLRHALKFLKGKTGNLKIEL